LVEILVLKMNSALRMPIQMPIQPDVNHQPKMDNMNSVNYSNAISDQFNNILEQRAQLLANQQPYVQYTATGPRLVPEAEATSQPASITENLPIPQAGAQGDPVAQYIQQNIATQAMPDVQVVKRSLTIAEVGVLFIAAIIAVSGIQAVWSVVPKPVVSIEWRR
jgi:hypothetical protein